MPIALLATDTPMRVLIADDHTLIREGLRRILGEQPDVEVVGEAATGADAIRMTRELCPDIVVLDVSMADGEGIHLTQTLTAMDPRPRVVTLTTHSHEHYALRTLRAGATGFLPKHAGHAELLQALRAAHAGERYLPQGVAVAQHAQVAGLSDREFQVLCLIAAGRTNREIADELAIRVKTVDTHRSHVLKKLGLRNNADIARFAVVHGYVTA